VLFDLWSVTRLLSNSLCICFSDLTPRIAWPPACGIAILAVVPSRCKSWCYSAPSIRSLRANCEQAMIFRGSSRTMRKSWRTVRALFLANATLAVSLAFAHSLPDLDAYTKYRENERVCRKAASAATSAKSRTELIERANEMAFAQRAEFRRGLTSVVIMSVAAGAATVRLAFWVCARAGRAPSKEPRAVANAATTLILVLASAVALAYLLPLMALLLLSH
jgi:hypothetical protein